MEMSKEVANEKARKRDLSKKEMEKLRELNLPPKAEKAIKEIWGMAEEQRDYNEISYTLKPVLSLIVANLFALANSSSIIESTKSIFYLIALAIILVFFIGAKILKIFDYSRLLESKDRKIILDWSVMCLFNFPRGLRRFFWLLTPFIIFVAIAYSLNTPVGIFYLFLVMYEISKIQVVREKAGQEIDKIEQE